MNSDGLWENRLGRGTKGGAYQLCHDVHQLRPDPFNPNRCVQTSIGHPCCASRDLHIGSAKGGLVNMQHQEVSLHLKQPMPLPICIADGQWEATQWSHGVQTSMSEDNG